MSQIWPLGSEITQLEAEDNCALRKSLARLLQESLHVWKGVSLSPCTGHSFLLLLLFEGVLKGKGFSGGEGAPSTFVSCPYLPSLQQEEYSDGHGWRWPGCGHQRGQGACKMDLIFIVHFL